MLEEVHASEVSLEARGSDVEEGGVAAAAGGAAPIGRKLTVYDEVGAGKAVNPFANRTPDLPATTKVLMAVCGLVLFPLRLVVLLVAGTLMGIFGNLAILGLSSRDLDDRPLSCWRKVLRFPAVCGVRLLLFSQGIWWITEKGRPAPEAEAPIVIANHTTFLDVMIIWRVKGAAVSASANKHIPVLGALANSFQFIFVDRTDTDSRANTSATIARRAADSRWPQTVIFPEGTTSNGSAVIAFKAGAFVPGKPVQVIAIKYHYETWGVDPSFVVGKPGMGTIGLRLLCLPWLGCTLTYLPVLVPTEAEKANAGLFARRAQEELAAALGVQPTMHSFDDVVLAAAAYNKHKLPSSAGITEFKTMKGRLHGIDVKTAKVYLERFAAIDGSKDGLISREEFSRIMQPQQPQGGGEAAKLEDEGATGFKADEVDRLFTLLDVDETGSLDFREFLVIMAFVNGDGEEARRDALRLAFRAFDEDDTGLISTTVLADILRRGLPGADVNELASLAAGADGDGDGQVSFADFLAFAESNASILPTFKANFFGGISTNQALPEEEPPAAASSGTDQAPPKEEPPAAASVDQALTEGEPPASSSADQAPPEEEPAPAAASGTSSSSPSDGVVADDGSKLEEAVAGSVLGVEDAPVAAAAAAAAEPEPEPEPAPANRTSKKRLPILKQAGYMHKAGHGTIDTGKKKRWFELDESSIGTYSLTYYTGEDKATQKGAVTLKGAVITRNDKAITVVEDESRSEGRTYNLECENSADAYKWAVVLEEAAARR